MLFKHDDALVALDRNGTRLYQNDRVEWPRLGQEPETLMTGRVKKIYKYLTIRVSLESEGRTCVMMPRDCVKI